MTNQVIPEAAVEAAARAMYELQVGQAWGDKPEYAAAWEGYATAALEAAAPHMMAQALESAAHAFSASVPEGEYSSTPTQVIDWLREYADAYRTAK